FWFNQDDRDVDKYLKYFTFLSQDEIKELAEKTEKEPHKREAQRVLDEEMTRFVNGQDELDEAIQISEALFSGHVQDLTAAHIEMSFKDVPSMEATATDTDLVTFLVDETKISPSRRQTREDIQNGAIYLKGERIQDTPYVVSEKDSYEGRFILVRRSEERRVGE